MTTQDPAGLREALEAADHVLSNLDTSLAHSTIEWAEVRTALKIVRAALAAAEPGLDVEDPLDLFNVAKMAVERGESVGKYHHRAVLDALVKAELRGRLSVRPSGLLREAAMDALDWWAGQIVKDKADPTGDALFSALRAALAATEPGLGDGVTTDCPQEGVHNHPFRGPHRFTEWYAARLRENTEADHDR